MSFKDLNKAHNSFTYKAPEGTEYVSLKDLYATAGADGEIVLRGLYINKHSQYGESPVAVITGRFVNLPKHLLATVKEIIADEEMVDQINAGNAGFKIREYIDRNGAKRYTVEWLDL